MATITDEEWEELKELGKNLPPFPEEFDLKMTRKILQVPSNIQYFFDGYRRDLKEKIGHGAELEEKSLMLDCDHSLRLAYKFMIFLHTKNLEMLKDHLDIIESLAFTNVELRKDLNKLIRMIKPTKNKEKDLQKLIQKIAEREKENSKFAKDYQKKQPYVNRFKDFLDHEAGKTTRK